MARVRRYGNAMGQPLANHYFSRSSAPGTYFNRSSKQIFSSEFLQATSLVSPRDTMAKLLEPVANCTLLDQMLYADTNTWLPDDLLVKADKITMANSMELRVPLLDHQVLEFAASLPNEHKVLGKATKRVLKAAFSKAVPTDILTRKKAGFPVPYSKWMRGKYADRVNDILLSKAARDRGYYQAEEVSRMLSIHNSTGRLSREVFSLLVVELWHQQFADSAGVLKHSSAC